MAHDRGSALSFEGVFDMPFLLLKKAWFGSLHREERGWTFHVGMSGKSMCAWAFFARQLLER